MPTPVVDDAEAGGGAGSLIGGGVVTGMDGVGAAEVAGAASRSVLQATIVLTMTSDAIVRPARVTCCRRCSTSRIGADSTTSVDHTTDRGGSASSGCRCGADSDVPG